MNESKKNLTVDPNLLKAKPQVAGGPNATVASDECFVAIKDPYRPKRLRASVCPWLFILMLAFGVQSVSAQSVWSEGYYFPTSTNRAMPISAIYWNALTHVAMEGGTPNSDGSITLSPGFSTDAPALIAAAHAHNVKTIYALFPSATGWAGAASSANLSKFIANIMSTVNTYGFDGAEIDWEAGWQLTESANVVSALRTALGSRLLVIDNVTMGEGVCNFGGTYSAASVALSDRVYIETYDFSGTWESVTAFSSPLFAPSGVNVQSVDGHIRAAAACGYPPAKTSIGIPFYGYLNTPNTGPYQSWGASSVLRTPLYYDMLATYGGFNGFTYDPNAHLPWRACTSGNPCGPITSAGWMQWENPQSITDKINYVKSKGLGGWGLWVIGGDYTSSASPTMPLLDAVSKAFGPQVQPPTGLQIMSVN